MRFPRNGTLTTLAPSLIQRDALKGLLPVAIINDDAEFAKTLLDNGADVNEQDEHGNNPLHVAAMRSSREKIITLLLDPKHKAKIDAQNKESYTPLHFAAMNNNSALVELLLKNKANVNVQNKEGNTPLHFAVKNKNTALVNLLLGAGANKDIANKAGKTALDIALDQKDDEMVEIILNFKGLHVELKNGQPLLLAHLNLASYNSLHLLLA
jgi:ankyrin repeat protein